MEMMVWRKTTLSYWFVKIRAKVILKVNYKNKIQTTMMEMMVWRTTNEVVGV